MSLFSIGKKPPGAAATEGPPEDLAELPEASIHDLDVRPVLARGEEPLALILQRAREVGPGEVLRLRAPFEPVPLYSVLAERGFEAWSERLAADDWKVWFLRAPKAAADAAADAGTAAEAEAEADGAAGTDERCGGAFRERKPKGDDVSDASEARSAGEPTRPARPVEEDGAVQGPYLLDVRRLDGPDKHPTIHERFGALGPGQALTIVNDHDPKPLFYEMCAEMPDRFDPEAYRSYRADERVWVAVLPVRAG